MTTIHGAAIKEEPIDDGYNQALATPSDNSRTIPGNNSRTIPGDQMQGNHGNISSSTEKQRKKRKLEQLLFGDGKLSTDGTTQSPRQQEYTVNGSDLAIKTEIVDKDYEQSELRQPDTSTDLSDDSVKGSNSALYSLLTRQIRNNNQSNFGIPGSDLQKAHKELSSLLFSPVRKLGEVTDRKSEFKANNPAKKSSALLQMLISPSVTTSSHGSDPGQANQSYQSSIVSPSVTSSSHDAPSQANQSYQSSLVSPSDTSSSHGNDPVQVNPPYQSSSNYTNESVTGDILDIVSKNKHVIPPSDHSDEGIVELVSKQNKHTNHTEPGNTAVQQRNSVNNRINDTIQRLMSNGLDLQRSISGTGQRSVNGTGAASANDLISNSTNIVDHYSSSIDLRSISGTRQSLATLDHYSSLIDSMSSALVQQVIKSEVLETQEPGSEKFEYMDSNDVQTSKDDPRNKTTLPEDTATVDANTGSDVYLPNIVHGSDGSMFVTVNPNPRVDPNPSVNPNTPVNPNPSDYSSNKHRNIQESSESGSSKNVKTKMFDCLKAELLKPNTINCTQTLTPSPNSSRHDSIGTEPVPMTTKLVTMATDNVNMGTENMTTPYLFYGDELKLRGMPLRDESFSMAKGCFSMQPESNTVSAQNPCDGTEPRIPGVNCEFWIWKCKQCNKTFRHAGTLNVHERTHAVEREEFKCNICGKVCSAARYLAIHMKTHQQKPSDKSSENSVQEKLGGGEIYKCEICDNTFTERENLLIHERMHTGEKLFKCVICDNGFTRRTQLEIHMRIHTGEKPYKCNECGKTFRQSNGLNLHMTTHADDQHKPYKCEICQKGFGRKAHYDKHIRKHRGERPYVCEICYKGFTDKFNLSMHVKTHSNQKDFKCGICQKGYNQATHLKNHMRFHTGESGYNCPHCTKVLEFKRDVYKHIRVDHPTIYAESHKKKKKTDTGGPMLDTENPRDVTNENENSSGGDTQYSSWGDNQYSSGGDNPYSSWGDNQYCSGGDNQYTIVTKDRMVVKIHRTKSGDGSDMTDELNEFPQPDEDSGINELIQIKQEVMDT